MARRSAGILLHRDRAGQIEVLLVHPGGPYWANRDRGAWSIPKGEYRDGDPLAVALREFAEETGHRLSAAPADVTDLGTVRQGGGKVVTAFAVEGDLEVSRVVSNTFRAEWPPRSGTFVEFPEVDRAAWFSLEEARVRLNPAQVAFLDRLVEQVAARRGTAP